MGAVCPERRRRAMTLTEVLVSSALGSALLAAVLAAMVFMARSGVALTSYETMDREGRIALDQLGRDLRVAAAISTTATSITITTGHPDYAAFGGQVTYGFDSSTSGPTQRSFYKMPGNAAAANTKTVLIRNVTAFSFSRFKSDNSVAGSDATTKRLRVNIGVTRPIKGSVSASDNLISASFVLRNS